MFYDLMKLRYGKELLRLLDTCSCGARYDVQHALSCKKDGFVSLPHNKIKNITAELLSDVYKDI